MKVYWKCDRNEKNENEKNENKVSFNFHFMILKEYWYSRGSYAIPDERFHTECVALS